MNNDPTGFLNTRSLRRNIHGSCLYETDGSLSCLLLVSLSSSLIHSFAKRERATNKTEATHTPRKSKPAQSSPAAIAPQVTSSTLQCDAQSALLMDGLTGEVLYEQNSRQKIAPASFVKVMTLYLVYDAIRAGQMKMEDLVTVSEKPGEGPTKQIAQRCSSGWETGSRWRT